MMKNRTRPVRIEFRVTEQERQLIQKKMDQLGCKRQEKSRPVLEKN